MKYWNLHLPDHPCKNRIFAISDGHIHLQLSRRHPRIVLARKILGCEQVFLASGNSTRSHGLGLSMKHLIAIDGSIEDSCFLFIYWMLLWEILQLNELSFKESVCLQELVDFFGSCIESGGTYTIAGKDFRFRLCLGQILHAGLQSAAAEGAEWDNFLAAQVHLTQEGNHGRRVCTEPHGIAEEHHIVFGDVGCQRLNLGSNALFLQRAMVAWKSSS